jgi:hypothetical protein
MSLFATSHLQKPDAAVHIKLRGLDGHTQTVVLGIEVVRQSVCFLGSPKLIQAVHSANHDLCGQLGVAGALRQRLGVLEVVQRGLVVCLGSAQLAPRLAGCYAGGAEFGDLLRREVLGAGLC